MKIVQQFHLWLVYKNILVKAKVGLKRNLALKLNHIAIYKRFGKRVYRI